MSKETSRISDRKRTFFRVLLASISLVFALAICELGLRVQDKAGPIYKLSGFEPELRYSYSFHHRRGDDESSVELFKVPESKKQRSHTLKILFLGDSWMESGDIVKGFAGYIESRLPDDLQLELINGGTASFSPSLLTLQGEYLIAINKPDIVLVNIDDTDLMDETLRYRPKSAFNANGDLLAVAPGASDVFFTRGFATLEQQPSYLLRAVEKVYYSRVFMPRLKRIEAELGLGQEATYERIMEPQLSANPHESHPEEIAYFRLRLDDMLERLSNKPSTSLVLLTHHPHFLHLKEENGQRYNNVVSETLSEVATNRDVSFFEAAPEVSKMYGDRVEDFLTWPEDKYSHLNEAGYLRYGAAMAEHFYPEIEAVWDTKFGSD